MISLRRKDKSKFAGIDIGSITTKAAILSDGKIVGTKVILTGYNAVEAGRKVFRELLDELEIDEADVKNIVATGYGRNNVAFAQKAITEITCHAAGARFLNSKIKTIIDVGGQDSKVISLDANGHVKDFAMNDKCAAGTGRFLEVMARALEVNLDDFGNFSARAEAPSKISSTCTVFAESEIISLISKGTTRENIIAGIHDAVAARITSMAKRIGISALVMMTGGVAKNGGVVQALEWKIGEKIHVSDYAQVNGAIGAAVKARGIG